MLAPWSSPAPLLLLASLCLWACGSGVGGESAPDAAVDEACTAGETTCGATCCGDTIEVCLYDDFCVASDATCTNNEDCQNDSYCDLETGYCVPYGEGPGTEVDESCSNLSVVGVFAPNIQCEWIGPPVGDPYPNHRNVLGTPVVIDFDFDGDPAIVNPSIAFVSYDGIDGGSGACVGSATAFGVIRVIDGQTCAQQAIADVHPVIAATALAVADLDGANDGRPEIVAYRVGGGMAAFKWDAAAAEFVSHWQTTSTLGAGICHWSGPSIHDLDNDGIAEVIMGASVFDGVDGTTIDESLGLRRVTLGQIPVIADMQGDGVPDLVTGSEIFRWDSATSTWISTAAGLGLDGLIAVADFGTYGADPGNDDRAVLDGIAEIVVVEGGQARLMTIAGRVLQGPTALTFFPPATNAGIGGPPTVSDFDGDGRVEYSVAGRGGYNVFDPDCVGTPDPATCNTMSTDGILWSQPTQDLTSSVTGSSVFDFEGDGRAEVVYADECFSRVYDGLGGEILYSAFRTSCTWYENPIVADVDGDFNSEIVIPSNENCDIVCPALDPIFDGLRCEADSDCPGTTTCAVDTGAPVGKCRCAADLDCGGNGYVCRDPVAGPSAAGQVCRAGHPGTKLQGVRVIRDALDRWVNSRPIWNQHAYSVTNISDTGKIPATSSWLQNWKQPGLNNFRQNIIGDPSLIGSPDLTAAAEVVQCDATGVTLAAKMCNRGTESVAAGAAMSFYQGTPSPGTLICTAQTTMNLAPEACEILSCAWTDASNGPVTVVADDPGDTGVESNAECHEDNNLSFIDVAGCVGVD